MAEVKLDNLNLPGNSMYTNDQNEKLKPVIDKSALVSVKKPLTKRLAESFLGFGDDIIDDVIVPGIKNMILDVLEERFFHTHGQRRYGPTTQDPYQYNTMYQYGGYGYGYGYNTQNRSVIDEPNRMPPPQTNTVDYRNIIVRTKQDAESIVIRMRERIKDFGKVSVADLFDLIQVPGLGYTDNNWGWTNPNSIGVRRVSQGYLIVVPEAGPLM